MAIARATDPPSAILIPENSERTVVVVFSEQEANEVNSYWRTIFGDNTGEQAREAVERYRDKNKYQSIFSGFDIHERGRL